MFVKLLNKIGLYTRMQYFVVVNRNVQLQEMNERLANSLRASEEVKSLVVEENKKLRLKITKRVKIAKRVKRRRR